MDKSFFKNAGTDTPNFIEDDYSLDWSMTRNERYCLIKLLEKIKPKISIEIGVYNGGSLQVLSENSEKVYAIEIDINVKKRLENKFSNVEFLIGDSKDILPQLLKELQSRNESVEFALIDGDHSALGVKTDITNLLEYVPVKKLHVLMHDSFNPTCRKGMTSVDYNKNKHVHYVEIDYISGVFEPDGLKNEMWGGLAHILLCNAQREGTLMIHQSQKKLFDIAYIHSKHWMRNKLSIFKPIVKFFKK